MRGNKIKLFAGTMSRKLTDAIAYELGVEPAKTDMGRFPDGETRVKINEDIRGSDVYIIVSTCPPVNDNLMELLILIDCLRRSSAGCITAVMPYFGYARQDRKDEGRVPITARLVANMISRAGADRVITMDLHAEQIQGFFDIPLDQLYGSKVIIEYLKTLDLHNPVVLAPDIGSSKRALAFAKRIGDNTEIALVEKRRLNAEEVTHGHIIGEVDDSDVVIPDDMISTGGTIVEAARLAKKLGGRDVYVTATHAMLVGRAIEQLTGAPIKEVIVTDTIPIPEKKQFENLKILSIAPLFAKAIEHIHENRSVSSLIS